MKDNAIVSLVVLVVLVAFAPWSAFAQDIKDLPDVAVITILNVEIAGLERTERFVVEREFVFEIGVPTTMADVRESVQRLRNLNIFRTAEFELIPTGEDVYDIAIVVDERWTLLPLGSFNFGGNLFSLVLGAFEVNLLGRYLAVGGSYQRLGTTNSFVVWAHDPRFLGRRLFAGTDFAWTNRLRYLFTPEGELEGGYLRFRRQFRFFANQELENWFAVGGSAAFQFDQFSYELVPNEVQDVQDANGGLPPSTRAFILTASLRLGRINANNYVFDGVRFSQAISHSNELWGSNITFTDSNTEVKGFLPLPLKSNLGGRVGFGATTSDSIEQQYFVGGFGTLRGFTDSRFRGSVRWYFNAEYRIPSFDYRWFVLQHVLFLDAAGAADRPSDIANIDGASTGLGLRVIIPKIYNFVARIDYAFGLQGNATAPLSFGAGHFF